jgi:hypothetical protein
MKAADQWSKNVAFLDAAITAGERIILATPPEKIPPGCTLEKECSIWLAVVSFQSLLMVAGGRQYNVR